MDTTDKIAAAVICFFLAVFGAGFTTLVYVKGKQGLQTVEVRERALASGDQVHIERVFGHRETVDRNTEINGDVIHGGEGLTQVSPLVLPRLGDL